MNKGDAEKSKINFELLSRSIREWFAHGQQNGFKYLLVCQDTFDAYRDEDMGIYPHYSSNLSDAKIFESKQLTGGDILMEVLDLEGSMESQLANKCRRNLGDFEQ